MFSIDRAADNFIALKIEDKDLQKVYNSDRKVITYLMRYEN